MDEQEILTEIEQMCNTCDRADTHCPGMDFCNDVETLVTDLEAKGM